MLDCPPHNQTSPTRTFVNSTVCRPTMRIVYGPEPAGGCNLISHRPSEPAVLVPSLLPIWMRIFSEGAAQPQNVFGFLRWRTMLSPNIGLTNGRDGAATVRA